MIYAVDVIGDVDFSWKAELFPTADRAYDFKAEMMADRDTHNRSRYKDDLEDGETTLSFEEWIAEGFGYNFRYVVVEFDSIKEADLFYEGYTIHNFKGV